MTESMIERVARAIEAAMFAPHELPCEPELHAKYLETARTAIEAMREPTERMLAEANRLNHPRDAEIYSAMIDAALQWPAGSADRAGVPMAED